MGKTILYTLKGAAIGAIGAVCLFVVGFCIELFNMGCAILTCDCDKPMVFDWSGMWGLLFICTIGGAVVGMVYGIYNFFRSTKNNENPCASCASGCELKRQLDKKQQECKVTKKHPKKNCCG